MELVFVFIEADEARFTNLERKLGEFHLPTNLNVLAFHGTFEEVLGSQLKSLEERDLALAPSFVFVDPFGPTGFPMALVERFAQYPMSEVLINFSYGPLNEWFLQDPSKHARLDDLFGGPRWRPALDKQPRQRELFLVSEYRAALQERGWRGLSFRMRNRHNQTQYYLLFGTRHYQGMLLMKSAMWQVAPDGVFQYSDFSDPNQLRLFTRTADGAYAQELAELLWSN